MPLSEANERELIHTRSLDIQIFRRGDGLWDVEARLIDVKPFEYFMLDATRAANEPIHDMSLRLTIDADMRVRAVAAVMDQGAHSICHRIAPAYDDLIGLQIGPGWIRAARQKVGGKAGCTHLTEMLGQMATAAFQAMWSEREAAQVARTGRYEIDPSVIDSCHTYRPDSVYVRDYFPEHYVPSGPASGTGGD